MWRTYALMLISLFCLLLCQTGIRAQEIVVPAGTLLHCTLDEPNFSSATADIGDPVLCHLSSLQQFGRTVFPRGSYLQGHLEAAKEPGHLFGKGYLQIQFDRIGLPNTDMPISSKIIVAHGYRVDRQGDNEFVRPFLRVRERAVFNRGSVPNAQTLRPAVIGTQRCVDKGLVFIPWLLLAILAYPEGCGNLEGKQNAMKLGIPLGRFALVLATWIKGRVRYFGCGKTVRHGAARCA